MRQLIYKALAKCLAYHTIGDTKSASEWAQQLVTTLRDMGLTIK